MGFCTSCGAPLGEGSRFCTGCGARIPAAHAASSPPEPPEKPWPAQPPQPVYFRQSAYRQPVLPYRQPGNDWGRYHPPARKRPLKHRSGLRFLSFLFALGLLTVAAGQAGSIYFSRYVSETLSGYLEEYQVTEEVSSGRKTQFSAALSAAMTVDIRKALIAERLFISPDADTSYISRMSDAELEPKRQINERMVRKGKEQYGIRWTILEIGLHGELMMIIGGILAGLSLVLWLSLGGRASNFSRAANAPLLTMFIIWGICIVILSLVIPAVNFFAVSIAEPAAAEALISENSAALECFPVSPAIKQSTHSVVLR